MMPSEKPMMEDKDYYILFYAFSGFLLVRSVFLAQNSGEFQKGAMRGEKWLK